MRKILMIVFGLLVLTGSVFAQGMWKDGVYTAQEAEFARGMKNMVRIVVANGYIVDVHFDAIPEDGGKYKYLLSVHGEYGMLQNGGAQAAWYEQVDRAAAEIAKTQDPAALVRSNGEVDAISGVSITILPHFELAQRALRNARR